MCVLAARAPVLLLVCFPVCPLSGLCTKTEKKNVCAFILKKSNHTSLFYFFTSANRYKTVFPMLTIRLSMFIWHIIFLVFYGFSALI